MVIFIGSLVGILMLKTFGLPIRLHLFGDYYACSANVKLVQKGYTNKIPLFNDGFAEILLLVVTRPKFLKMS